VLVVFYTTRFRAARRIVGCTSANSSAGRVSGTGRTRRHGARFSGGVITLCRNCD
jgi:hypothetical protein